jgi:hypothetical protein
MSSQHLPLMMLLMHSTAEATTRVAHPHRRSARMNDTLRRGRGWADPHRRPREVPPLPAALPLREWQSSQLAQHRCEEE